ncbi:hypothetical protein [Acinetobacter guillouiae]|uniref:hypothetical protein n=1 Tax=Acinetobacter guillouiae TaxID=106649 RepID=UPI00148F37E5|nr:hypothetical protein [Acinetobacter guillouiae]
MQIREKGQTAQSPNSPKPFRFPHALRLDGLDYEDSSSSYIEWKAEVLENVK